MSIVRECYFSEKLNPEEHKNLEDLTIVWFDRNTEEVDDCKDFQFRLREVINYVVIFNDYILCKDYLLSLEQEKVFLIVSGINGESLVNLIHHLSKLNSIYIFCFEKIRHEEWSKKYPKIRGVYENKDELLKILKNDASICLSEILPMRALGIKAIQKSLKELNEEGGSFVWSHFLIYILRSMENDNNAKNELIDLSRQQYIGNEKELNKILDFENNYTSDKAIWWYTKDSFLYRLLNKALRTDNFDIIYKFRFLIVDLHQQLKTMYPLYTEKIFSSEKEEIFTVYRGQRLPLNEFKKIKENEKGFISMNTFLSTTTQSEVALTYCGNGEDRPLLESVLFQIEIEKSYLTEPFADISQVSFFKDENEILFTIGTIFRINSIYDLTPTITVIELSLVKHNDEDIGRLTQYLNQSISSKPTLDDLNNIFLMIDDYQRVLRYTQIILEQTSITDINRASIYITLGNAQLKINGNYDQAEKFYLDAEQIVLNSPSCNYHILISVYSSIGLLEIEKNNHSVGLEVLNNVLEIALNNSFESSEIIHIYSNLGLAYRNALKFDQACENYEKALNIIKESNELPKLHPSYSIIYNNLAYTKQLQYDYDQALEYYNSAFEIQKKSLPKIHSVTATTLGNIALLHMMKDEDEIALKKYETVVNMFTEIYGDDHPRLATVFNNIADIYSRSGENEKAKEYLNKALNIRLNNTDIDDNNLAAVYTSLAFVHCRLGSFDESLNYSFKALDIRLKIPSEKRNDIFITYLGLAECYVTNFDYDQSLFYYELAQKHSPPKSLDMAIILERFGNILCERKEYEKAIPYVQKSINIQLELTTRNNIRLAKSHKNIGVLYAQKGKHAEALTNFRQGLNLAPDNLLLAAEFNLAIADIYLQSNEFDQVSYYLQIAKSIFDTIDPVNHHLNAKIFCTTGFFYLKIGYPDLAVQELKNAVVAFEKDSSQFCSLLCETYQHLVLTLLQLNKNDEAIQILEKIKEISSVIYANNSSLIVPFYHRVSSILRDKNLLKESLIYAEHALAAATVAQSIDYYKLSNIYDLLSTIYRAQKDFRRARIEILNNFYICHKYCPGNLVLCQISLANIYIIEGSTQEAIHLLDGIPDEQLLSARNYSPAKLSKDMAFIYNSLTQYQSSLRMIQFSLNHITNAEHYIVNEIEHLVAKISHTLQQRSEALKHVNLDLANVYDCLGKYYKSTKNNSAAVKHFETTMGMRLCYMEFDDSQLDLLYNDIDQLYFKNTKYQELENIFGNLMKYLLEQVNNGNALKIRTLLGLAHTRQTKIDQSIHYYELAIKLSLNLSSPDYKTATFIYNHISRVYLSDGKHWESVQSYEKAIEMASKIEPHDSQLITLLEQNFQLALESLIKV